MYQINHAASAPGPWNKGKLVGQKAPLKLKHIWAIRVRLELADRARELALFNLAIDSKLRSCDLVKLRVRDVCHGNRVAPRAIIMQQKTQRPVQFEITEQTRDSLSAWIRLAARRSDDCLFPSRLHGFNAAYQSGVDLSADEEPARGAVAARPLEARKHRTVPRDRG